jgi:hypothetical protein
VGSAECLKLLKVVKPNKGFNGESFHQGDLLSGSSNQHSSDHFTKIGSDTANLILVDNSGGSPASRNQESNNVSSSPNLHKSFNPPSFTKMRKNSSNIDSDESHDKMFLSELRLPPVSGAIQVGGSPNIDKIKIIS